MKTWPLAVSPFTTADRLKISWRLLRGHQMTAGAEVRRYEESWEKITGAPHAIMVSNGSVANELIARRRKEELIAAGHWPRRNRVIFPVCNWVTSVAPWLMLGFQPVWADISQNLCASSDEIGRLLRKDVQREIGTIFYTTLLGQATYLAGLVYLCEQHDAKLLLDNCESSFSRADEYFGFPPRHLCSVATSSTSFYFSHPATTGTEGGMIFCHSDEEADWFRMIRNHGLTRGMPIKYLNEDVDPAFDFYLLGTNARSSDLQAYMGSVVLPRQIQFCAERIRLATLFYGALCKERFCDITQGRCTNPLMALPIVPNPTGRVSGTGLRPLLKRLGVEHRPVVGGNLLRQTAFKQYGNPKLYPRAEWLHDHGVYVGLHPGVTGPMVLELAAALNIAR